MRVDGGREYVLNWFIVRGAPLGKVTKNHGTPERRAFLYVKCTTATLFKRKSTHYTPIFICLPQSTSRIRFILIPTSRKTFTWHGMRAETSSGWTDFFEKQNNEILSFSITLWFAKTSHPCLLFHPIEPQNRTACVGHKANVSQELQADQNMTPTLRHVSWPLSVKCSSCVCSKF